ncbi:interleukin-8-like [Megalops cyprinoides]|uniref:interleukin-8-like n=1 Tax=Megalops cyprinoides TaxID=118141 RepID=UPI0018647AB7|nr:interleukin-8-like [Megalops cyprinoides]
MNHKVTTSALVLCLVFMSVAEGGLSGDMRCRCPKTQSKLIPRKDIKNLELIPAGPHCKVAEIIATMKGGKQQSVQICLDPKAQWVANMIEKMTAKMNAKKK